MQPKSLLSGGIGELVIVVIVATVFICAEIHGVGSAEKINCQQTSSQIKNLHEFLDHIFDGRTLEFYSKNLTKPGEGCMSVIRALEVKLRNSNSSNEVETLELAIKTMQLDNTLPEHNIAQQTTYFMKELNFYAEIIPAIEQFQVIGNVPENEKIDAFVRYFGSRFSLNESSKTADADAILLLENAKSLNFTVPNVLDRFDKDEVYVALKQLAKLQASWIAMRRLQPTLYYSKIDPHIYTEYGASYVERVIKAFQEFYDIHLNETFLNMSANVRAAIQLQFEMGKNYFKNVDPTPDTPYTTFYHRDIHMKNFLIKRDEADGKSIKVKILDFQRYKYESFAFDLLQFLFINARIDDLRAHFKSFVEHYLSEFVNTMRIVDCPLDDYTNEKMWNEITNKAKLNLFYLYLYSPAEKYLIEIWNNSTSSQDNSSLNQRQNLTYDMVFNRWKCIVDLYIEHGFLVVN